MPQETEQGRLGAIVCKTSLIQLSMQCIHERILSTVGEVGLEVILNIAFILLQGKFKEMIVMRFMMKTAAMTTMMAGPRTVGLGFFSPVQQLDERSEASLIE
jgi:hypothetical protein